MRVGLYFGSFNPVHNGHLAIAEWIVVNCGIDEVRLVVSALNPFKKPGDLISGHHRLKMAELAAEESGKKIKASGVELKMPAPSYTIDTIRHLASKEPVNEFIIIMGEDNLPALHKWKEIDKLMEMCEIIVYPRSDTTRRHEDIIDKGRITVVNAPLHNISATMIREVIAKGQHASHLLPNGVLKYIRDQKLYV